VRHEDNTHLQKFLAGQQLPGYGGQTFACGRVTLQLPRLEPEEAELAVTQLLSHPEIERPARPESAAGPAARTCLSTCKGMPFPKVTPPPPTPRTHPTPPSCLSHTMFLG